MLASEKMRSWKFNPKSAALDWLLEENNPSVRYFTLIDILGEPETDCKVVKAKKNIMKSGIVSKILSGQKNEGYWETVKGFYTTKYKGTVWQLIILAELGADGEDEHIKKACEFILENSQERESGGFSIRDIKTGGGACSGVIPCLTGNMVWSLIRLGYLDDPRVQAGISWITTFQRFDDGEGALKGWPYDKYEMCFGKHSCHMGAAKAVK